MSRGSKISQIADTSKINTVSFGGPYKILITRYNSSLRIQYNSIETGTTPFFYFEDTFRTISYKP